MLKKILLTGSSGFIGSNVLPFLQEKYCVYAPKRNELNLKDSVQVKNYLKKEQFDTVVHFASPTPAKSVQYDKFETLFEDSLRIFMNFYSMQEYFGRMIYSGSGAEFDKRRDIISVTEDEFGRFMPSDAYGLSKYIINELASSSQNIYNLRIFGCYGPHEYNYKFITHAICCCMNHKPITIRQDCYFDYLYVDDYAKYLMYFIENTPKFHSYNASSGKRIKLSSIAEIVKTEMNNPYPVEILSEGMNTEYTADNRRIMNETKINDLISIEEGIRHLIDVWNKVGEKQ